MRADSLAKGSPGTLAANSCKPISLRGPVGSWLPSTFIPSRRNASKVFGGTLRLSVNGKEKTTRVGEFAVVPAGRPHVWWNESGRDRPFGSAPDEANLIAGNCDCRLQPSRGHDSVDASAVWIVSLSLGRARRLQPW